MFDTEKQLALTTQAMQLDDPNYPMSWMESGGGTVDGQPR
jgi:homogentisate 1,2-dioxygenase